MAVSSDLIFSIRRSICWRRLFVIRKAYQCYTSLATISREAMTLWIRWWNVIWLLCPAFSRLRTFVWFVTAVAGLTVRTDLLGVATSIVRALKLRPRLSKQVHQRFPASRALHFYPDSFLVEQVKA
jgi:hypothetical protein